MGQDTESLVCAGAGGWTPAPGVEKPPELLLDDFVRLFTVVMDLFLRNKGFAVYCKPPCPEVTVCPVLWEGVKHPLLPGGCS